jgi:hypothetical protein
MGFKLLILAWWTPKYIIQRELSNVSNQTTVALESLLTTHAPQEAANSSNPKPQTSIKEQRAKLAQTQSKLVQALEAKVGHEEAVRLGRKALFLVGENLGEQTRRRLSVGDNSKDLIKAAKVLYRVLGIDFHLRWLDKTKALVIVDHCALAEQYSELTCKILSATDEGVIKGLQPNCTMRFKEYMTSGCNKCRADIKFNEKETIE